jgi:hypothetical protein
VHFSQNLQLKELMTGLTSMPPGTNLKKENKFDKFAPRSATVGCFSWKMPLEFSAKSTDNANQSRSCVLLRVISKPVSQ